WRAVSSSDGRSRATIATLAPSWASTAAMALPIPRLPPVTRAPLPASSRSTSAHRRWDGALGLAQQRAQIPQVGSRHHDGFEAVVANFGGKQLICVQGSLGEPLLVRVRQQRLQLRAVAALQSVRPGIGTKQPSCLV